jgi:hypothetical protein
MQVIADELMGELEKGREAVMEQDTVSADAGVLPLQ